MSIKNLQKVKDTEAETEHRPQERLSRQQHWSWTHFGATTEEHQWTRSTRQKREHKTEVAVGSSGSAELKGDG